MKTVKPILISGREVFPIIEGGKGVAVSNGLSAGAFAAAGAVGTVSVVNADSYDENGDVIPQIYTAKTRRERFEEMIDFSIKGGVTQVNLAHEKSQGNGRIHINMLWEAGGTQRVLKSVLEQTKGKLHGVTCGAGMPYKVAEIVAEYGVHYLPIVSSMRAFRALWKRAFKNYPEWLGGVVYEDPWKAGGHNGLSNVEDPKVPQDPYPRVAELRKFMNEVGLEHVPIVMAGGVWYLRDWENWLDNPELGPIAFQFGTRALLTQESPISKAWQSRLMSLKEGDVYLNKFSPTGFYSSGVRNNFLNKLKARSERQIPYAPKADETNTEQLTIGPRNRVFHVSAEAKAKAEKWMNAGQDIALRTPDSTLVFCSEEEALEIREDQRACMGCLSQCMFSNWADNEKGTTGRMADPRSFCIQKTLQAIAHGGDLDNELMFAGHNAFKYADDPFFSNSYTPTVKELVDRILTGD
ncbi:MAG: nitronate monooxygenase [Alphaproteobacteria bacterium]|nr:nitronate monooxygenase [Rhodospirillales bacterium]MCW9046119.1 nitronate monooxygenase [Alphaproteobacteria bacterium]